MTAVVAVDAQEPMGEDTALEIAPNLAFDEAGDGRAHRSCAGEEGLELGSDDLMEEGLLGLVAFVAVDGWEPIGAAAARGGERSGSCLLGRVHASRVWAYTAGEDRAKEHVVFGLALDSVSKTSR